MATITITAEHEIADDVALIQRTQNRYFLIKLKHTIRASALLIKEDTRLKYLSDRYDDQDYKDIMLEYPSEELKEQKQRNTLATQRMYHTMICGLQREIKRLESLSK